MTHFRILRIKKNNSRPVFEIFESHRADRSQRQPTHYFPFRPITCRLARDTRRARIDSENAALSILAPPGALALARGMSRLETLFARVFQICEIN